MTSTSSGAPTRLANRYRVEAVLKDRDRIQVLRAVDEKTGRDVKIKRRPPGVEDRWFQREADLLATLDHPRVPRTLTQFEEDGAACVVQTYFHGETAREFFKRRKRLTRTETLQVLASVLEILVYLHGRTPAVVHRDLKPGNMVMVTDHEVALIDFGIASNQRRDKHKVDLQDLTSGHTVGYAPPEQVIGLEAVPASDVYALGATALYMHTGAHPTRLWDARAGRLRAPADMDRELARLLEWMTEPGLAARCTDAREAFSAVLILQQKDFIARNLPTPPLNPRPIF